MSMILFGLLQPIVIKLKILFQEICMSSVGWDDLVCEKLCNKWHNIVEEMRNYKNIEVKRCYFDYPKDDNIERIYLHGFSDASEQTYAACVYIKYITRAGYVGVKLISSKSRVVALRKKYTMPRLELLGNLIVANLMFVIFNVLKEDVEIHDCFYWSDSMICLAWIKSTDKEYKTFIENRLSKIRSQVPPDKWRYCKSEENPADVITRFKCHSDKHGLFYNGPSLLRSCIENHSELDKELMNDDSLPPDYVEEQKITLLATSCDGSIIPAVNQINNVEAYSDINKLFRVTGYVLRFIHNLRKRINAEGLELSNYVTVEEYRKAEQLWIKDNQVKLNESKVLCKQLTVIPDSNGILRCIGRINNASLPYDVKNPILLDRKHKVNCLRSSSSSKTSR